jgi:hypothetical protein
MLRKLSNKLNVPLQVEALAQSNEIFNFNQYRYLIKASSEKKGASEIVLFHLPSIGDIAFNLFKVVIV